MEENRITARWGGGVERLLCLLYLPVERISSARCRVSVSSSPPLHPPIGSILPKQLPPTVFLCLTRPRSIEEAYQWFSCAQQAAPADGHADSQRGPVSVRANHDFSGAGKMIVTQLRLPVHSGRFRSPHSYRGGRARFAQTQRSQGVRGLFQERALGIDVHSESASAPMRPIATWSR